MVGTPSTPPVRAQKIKYVPCQHLCTWTTCPYVYVYTEQAIMSTCICRDDKNFKKKDIEKSNCHPLELAQKYGFNLKLQNQIYKAI
jgi:hypothetical protein